MKKIETDLIVKPGVTLNAPELERIVGYLALYRDATLNAPELERIVGDLAVESSATFNAPNLKSVNGKSYKA